MEIKALYNHLINLNPKQKTIIIGIDGCGGSGKSTLAKKIVELNPTIQLIHMDDFYLPTNRRHYSHLIGGDFDWNRLKEQVLDPLSKNESSSYQKYNWNLDYLDSWHTINVEGMILIEGVYSLRHELIHYYDYKIFVDCPKDLRLYRGVLRDGEAMRDTWENKWMVSEELYLNAQEPMLQANLIIDGTKKYY